MVYGYARCSTDKEEGRQDVAYQVRELKQLGAADDTIYIEYESGAKADREKLNELLDVVMAGDVIVTTEISRITRSTKQLCDLRAFIQDNRLQLIVKNSINIDCTNGEMDAMSKAFLQMAGVFAELERDMTRQRVKSGLKNAREKGVKLGRPEKTADDVPPLFLRHYPQYKEGNLNKVEFARVCGLSYPSIFKYIRLVEQ